MSFYIFHPANSYSDPPDTHQRVGIPHEKGCDFFEIDGFLQIQEWFFSSDTDSQTRGHSIGGIAHFRHMRQANTGIWTRFSPSRYRRAQDSSDTFPSKE